MTSSNQRLLYVTIGYLFRPLGRPQRNLRLLLGILFFLGGLPLYATVVGSGTKVAHASAPTCAEGGLCSLGDIGPGGGLVFYVHASGTFACGVTLASACRYLEAAPTTGSTPWVDQVGKISVANYENNILFDNRESTLGHGRINTESMVTQNTNSPRAQTIARAYRGPNNRDDWFLPSFDELGQMYEERERLGFVNAVYWSSTGCCSARMLGQNLVTGAGLYFDKKTENYVRPIRAFDAEGALRVTFDSQGGSPVLDNVTMPGGSIAGAPVAPTRDGFVFAGWFVASSGGSAITFPYTHGQTANFTLYAQWGYAVSFDGNGATGGSAPSIQLKSDGVDLTVASNTGSLVRTGYTFAGWNTQADGNGTAYAEGASYSVDAALTLYAVWTANPTPPSSGGGGGGFGVPPPSSSQPPSVPQRPEAPSFVNAGNVTELVRTPGQGAALVNGEARPVELGVVRSPDAQRAPNQRTPEQIAQIREAAKNLVESLTAVLPSSSKSVISVTPTETGAAVQGLLNDRNGAPLDVPVESVVVVGVGSVAMMVGGENSSVTGSGLLSVPEDSIFGMAGGGLKANQVVQVVIMSTPTLVADSVSNDDGTFTLSGNFLASIGPGDHTLVLSTEDVQVSLGIRVTESTPSFELPVTGNETFDLLMTLGLFLLIFGILGLRVAFGQQGGARRLVG